MPTIPFDIIGSYQADYDPIIDPQYLGNMYETVDANAPAGKALISFPGSKLRLHYHTLASTAEVRTMFTSGNYLFDVTANTLHKVSSDLSYTTIGTLLTSSGYIDTEQNLTQTILVDGGSGYIYDGSTVAQIVSVNFPSDPISVAYLNGYFIVASSTSGKFYISALEDGTTWNAFNWAQMTTKAQNLMALTVLGRHIYIFSKYITEVWYPTGGSGFPFNLYNNLLFEQGCAATGSLITAKDFMIWLASTPSGDISVQQSNGASLKELTSKQMKMEFQSYTTISDARAYLIDMNGHTQYIITFPTQNKSWGYDLLTNKWFAIYMVNKGRYFAQCHAYFNGKHYIGIYNQPKIYEVNKTYKLNGDEIIPKKRIAPNFSLKNGNRMMINTFEVKFKQGDNALIVEQEDYYYDDASEIYKDDEGRPYYNDSFEEVVRVETNPVVYLSTSDDGGKTFGYSISQPLGKSGEFKNRTIWTNLGIYDQFIPKLEFFERMGLIITEANVDIEEIPR